jgi:A/G-specific adenine glycosylase
MNKITKRKANRPSPANPGHPVNPVSKTQPLVSALLEWFAVNARDLPWRRTDDPYAIWVSEIMLQQTQVKTVIPYWERWMRELPTIESLASASANKIHKLWEGLGYYTRVRNMQKAAQQIIAEHGGKFPKTFEAVLALPGIGRYTAGAICSIAFNQPTPILDGNVIRVLTRVYGIATDPREKQTNAQLWQLAEELVTHAKDAKGAKESRENPLRPSRPWREHNACSHLNQSLMELGALICTPRSTKLRRLPRAKTLRRAIKKILQDQLPNLAKREAATERRFIAFVVEHNGKFLVRQRPEGVVNAHLWEFPNIEVGARVCDPQHSAAKEQGFNTTAAKSLCTIKHSITRYRITLEAWHAELATQTAKIPGRWLTPKELHQLAFTSAHKKILQAITEAKTQKLKIRPQLNHLQSVL